MLILTRKVGESLMIGDDIEVVVMDLSRNQVKIGIAAPKDVAVLRTNAKDRTPKHGTANGNR